MSEPSMSRAQAEASIETKTAPRVTLEGMKAKVVRTQYVHDGTLTVAILELRNGFKLVGESAAASAANFDPEVGKRIAYDNALNKLWPLEGYVLRERLHLEGSL